MLDPTLWRRIESLLDEAADVPASERDAFLNTHCRDESGALDTALRDEVARLLALDDEAGGFFGDLRDATVGADGDGALASAVFGTPALDDLVGREVGRYIVEERVGTGGMGAVYRARRADGTFARPVALKVVRPGLAADVGPRFARERKLLGSLDHPHVARLLDAGALEDGRPWIAMEFVQGEPITRYADSHELSIEARLRLFLQVCDAVAYAHRQLVVHRDLKPSNVLVATVGGEPRAVLLDFGIATLVREDGAATRTGRTLLTPAYAAPEQVRDEPTTTAADVYALGALLYELLSGVRTVQTEGRPSHLIVQDVLDRTAPPPSTVVTAEAASKRGGAREKVTRRLRGDLDRIVGKALRKERVRRYSSVEGLARDVGRHLAGRTIEARPDTLRYRMTTFVRRNRTPVAAGLIALAAVVGGAGIAASSARQAGLERDRAEQQRQRAEEVSEFLTDLLGEFDPSRSGGSDLSPDSVLARATASVRASLDAHPDVRADLLASLGQIHQSYARFDDAQDLFVEALDLRRASLGDEHPDVGTGLRDLAWLAYVRGDYDRAEALYADALAIHRHALGEDHLDVAANLEGLGLVHRIRGDLDAALNHLQRSLVIREAQLPPGDERLVSNLNTLAYVLYNHERYDEAEPLYQRVLAQRRQTLGEHVQTAQVLNDYAALLLSVGRPADALALHREALAMRERLLGPLHPHVAQSLSAVGWVLQTQARYAEAEDLYRRALEARRSHFGSTHVSVANSLLLLGEVCALQGKTDAGLGLIEDGVRVMEASLGAEHKSALLTRLRYAERLAEAGRVDETRRQVPALRRLRDLLEAGDPVLERIRAVESSLDLASA
ncbi:MAG: serine/threonine-protein kinase [Bacteroidota bacterium]